MTFVAGLLGRVAARPLLVPAVVCALILGLVLMLAGIARGMLARAEGALAPLLTSALSEALGREVRVGAAHVRGFATLAVLDLAIAQPGGFDHGTAFRAPSITAQLDLPSFALARFQRPWAAVRRVDVQSPSLEVARDAAGHWDVADVTAKLRTMSSGQWHAPAYITGGTATVHDALAQAGVSRIALANIAGRVTTAGGLRFAASAEEPALGIGTVRASGGFDRETGLSLDVRAPEVSAERVGALLPPGLPLTVRDGAAAVRLSTLLGALSAEGAWGARDTSIDVDVRGIGLKLKELTAPLEAQSGHIRLAQDGAGHARVTLDDVRGTVGALPVTLAGTVEGVNLSAPHFGAPTVDVRLSAETPDGGTVGALFPDGRWPAEVILSGATRLSAQVTGPTADLTIAGDLRTDTVRVRDFAGRDAHARVTLRPAAREGAVVNAAVTVGEAHFGNARARDFAATLATNTPWRDLEDAPVFVGTVRAAMLNFPGGELADATGNTTLTRDGVRVDDLRAGLWGGRVSGVLAASFQTSEKPATEFLSIEARLENADLGFLPVGELAISGRGGADARVRLLADGGVRADGRVTLRGGQVAGVSIVGAGADFDLDVRDTGVRLAVARAEADTDAGRFALTDGSYRGDTADLAAGSIAGRVHGEAIPTGHFSARLDARATLDGTVSGTPRAPAARADVEARDGQIDGRPFDRVAARLIVHGTSARWHDIRFERRGLTIAADGGPDGVDVAHPEGLTAHVHADGADLGETLGLLGVTNPWPVDGPLVGEADLTVGAHGVSATGQASITGAMVHLPLPGHTPPLRLSRMSLDFSVDGTRLAAREFRLERDGTTIVATGELSWAERRPRLYLAFRDAGAKLEELPLDLFGVPVRLSGATTIVGSVAGPLGRQDEPLVVRGRIGVPAMAVGGIGVGRTEATLAYRHGADGDELSIERAALHTGAGTLSATGVLRPGDQVDLRADGAVELADVTRLLGMPAMSGQASLSARVHGPWSAPVASADMAADDLTLLGRPLGHTEARARLAGHTLTLDGALTPPGALSVTLAASIPLHTRGARLDLDMDGPLTAHATVPRQPLAPLVRVLPWLAHAEGEAAAEIVVAGTLARPYLASAQVDLSGGLGITGLGPDLPNRLEGADLRLRVSGDARRTHVALERLTGAFGWSTGGRGTGSVTADGTVDIPREALLRPMLWRWDLAGQVVDLPLPRRLAIVPRVSGVLRLAGEGRPRLTGVLAGQDMKIAMPAATSATAPAWGPFDFDPELSLVLEAGPGVRVAKSILRIPLRPTPLALPPMVAGPLDRSHPAFATTADLLRAGHPDELSGTWGLVTGSLDAPRVYARYEVDKGRLKFPLNLIGAIRNKHGHVTYDLQDGVRMLD